MTVSRVRAGASGVLRPPSPVLDGIKAEPKRVRESGLSHAKSIADSFHVNLLRHMCPESFLLASKKSLNVVKAIHHLLELRFMLPPVGLENTVGPFL